MRFTLPAVAAAVALAQPAPQHDLVYQKPATTWDEAFPLGNGMLGALVWGAGQPLRISLDRADLWDLRPVPEFSAPGYTFANLRSLRAQKRFADIRRIYEDPYKRPAPTKIPAGRIEIDLPGAAFTNGRLSLAAAEARVEFSGGQSATVFVHAVEQLGFLRFTGQAPPALRLNAPAFSGQVSDPAQGGIGAGDLAQLGYAAPERTSGPNWRAYHQMGALDFHYAAYLEWKPASGGWEAAWSVASSFEGPDPLALARARAGRALAAGYQAKLESHRRWWDAFWSRSAARLPNAVVEKQWHLEQYKFGSAARRGAPPITLQAVWTADDGKLPPWKGDYHHDLNTQLSYWPAYSGNHLEEGLGYLDWLWKTRDTAYAWTKQFFALPGLNVPMTADLNGAQIGGWVQYTHSPTTSAWLAHHFYLHWRYSADREFLRTRAYPYLRDVAVFLEAFTSERDATGRRTVPLSASPEINDNKPEAWFDQTTNYDLSLARWLFETAAELATELRLAPDAARWRKAASELPALALAEDGGLLVAPGYPLAASHRHFSHLMAVHPLGLVAWEDGEAARRTVRASLAHLEKTGTSLWCGYSFSWLGSLAARARDGAAAERAIELFSTAFTLRNSFHVNGDQTGRGYSKFTYRPFTLEGNFAAAAGVQEMLLQSQRGLLRVFPAIPEAWRDVSFRTLRAEGAVLVSAVRKAGRVESVELLSERGGPCRIVSPWTGETLTLHLRRGERRALRAP